MKRLSLLLCLAGAAYAVVSAGDWSASVPEQVRTRQNPLAGDVQASAVGRRLFEDHCAACHGDDAQGKGKKPSLRSQRVKNATDGELHWLLTNGSLKKGMPSWSRLPEEQRWQIVSYLKTLK